MGHKASYAPYEYYIKSEQWQKKRKLRLEIDNNQCVMCGRHSKLNVHHLTYQNLGFENACDDLVTLCETCHALHHSYENTPMFERSSSKIFSKARQNTYSFIRRKALQFAEEHQDMDLSSLRSGSVNLCDYSVSRPLFVEYLENYGITEYKTGLLIIQNYFTRKRYSIILDLLKQGATPYEIQKRTGFSRKSIDLVLRFPAQARRVIDGSQHSINSFQEE